MTLHILTFIYNVLLYLIFIIFYCLHRLHILSSGCLTLCSFAGALLIQLSFVLFEIEGKQNADFESVVFSQ
jgi:hypothetical protein